MSDAPPDTEALEKQIRTLEKKLERSERYRTELEDMRDRGQSLHRQLQAEVEAARREAEITAALERVRARAMAMRKPDDLSGICEVVFTELKNLGFEALRNAEVIINHDQQNSVTSYYYSDYGVTGVIDVDYTSNPTVAEWARQIQQADDAFAEVVIAEDQMDAWRDYRESIGCLPDPKLNDANAVYYYSHSTGLGALSISCFQPVSAEQISVLEQFRNVFQLAYQRYVDIALAEAQAREAQIQLALERIRTQSMLMQHSSELVATSSVFHEQLLALGVATEFSYVWLPDEAAGKHQFWATWTTDEGGTPVHRSRAVTYDLDKSEPYTAACFEAWGSDDPVHVDFIPPADIESFFSTWDELLREAENLKPEYFPDGIYYAEGYMTYGCLGVNIRTDPSERDREILRRFAAEFAQSYRRFLDLQRAEAQAREAEIEAALERVRARAMAMRNSDEIREMVVLILEEMKALAFPSGRCTIILFDSETGDSDFWMTGLTDSALPDRFHVPYHDLPTYKGIHDAWRQGRPFYEVELAGEVKRRQDDFWFEKSDFGRLPAAAQAGMRSMDHLWLSNAIMSHGVVQAVGPEPLAEEKARILQRFARVIELTYTRVEDIQQSEAQVREAQIETAMERVRSRALAMTKSDELLDVVFKIHQEFSGLGLDCGAFWHTRYTPDAYHKALTGIDGQKLAAIMELPRDFTSNPALAAWERGDEKIGVFKFDADAASEYLHHMVSKGKFHEVDPEAITEEMIRENDGWTFVQARTSHGEIGYSLWGETDPSDEAKDVLIRFTGAFDLAYRRFEDLQQAEEDHRALLEEKALTERALEELKATQAQLVQSEKMASLGALTAGIAHEIKNPLNFVNNFAGLSEELFDELESEEDPEERAAILETLKSNAAKIQEHGTRADSIVRAMMQHASGKEGERRPVVINQLVEEYVNLAYHGKRAQRPDANATIDLDTADDVGELTIVGQDVGRVLVNLINNAFDAVFERADTGEDPYEPTIRVATSRDAGHVTIRISDNGGGMPDEVRERVFDPFFTTKPTGQGTGLGLSMSYDIVVQGHGGRLAVESEVGRGSTFLVRLPV